MPIQPAISISHRLEYHATVPAQRTITQYAASEQAWNCSAYEFYLCHRTFRELGALNAHLASPAHDGDDEFMCPKCRRTYKLVSGLVQHMESEAYGIARFQQIDDQAHSITSQFARMLKF
jgi:hypothetical protein